MSLNRNTIVNMNSASSAFVDAVAITPSDSTIFNPPIRGIYVGGAGNVSVVTVLGSTVTFTAPPVGTILDIKCTQVRLTGTTATNLVGLY